MGACEKSLQLNFYGDEMNIIALDTVTDACSVAVQKGKEKFFKRTTIPQAHTKLILDMCTEVLEQSGLQKSELDLIACGRGPGSFTGVRIGIAVAQGLAFGLGKKILGISDLQTMAQGAIVNNNAQMICVANDARMNEVYFCAYENQNGKAVPLMEETVSSPEVATEKFREFGIRDKCVLVGTGFQVYESLKNEIGVFGILGKDHFPYADDMLDLAESMVDLAVDPEQIVPVYLRDKVTWKKVSEQKK